jgi:hypothetical protein
VHCRAIFALAALVISSTLAVAQSCIRPSFNIPGEPFSLPSNSGEPGIPLAIATGRFFTRENRTPCDCDLAVALSDQATGANRLVIMRGSSAGTYDLSTAMTITFKGSPAMVIGGRFHTGAAQALDDLILVLNTDKGETEVHVMVPAADGQYNSSSRLDLRGNPIGTAKGDFDGDGNLDFAVMNDQGSLTILRGDGRGQFRTVTVTGLSGQAKSVTAGVFTGRPQRNDIGVALIDAQGKINIAIVGLSGSATFSIIRTVATGETGVEASIAAANLSNNNQWRDIALASSNSNASEAGGRVRLLLGRADGQGFTDGAVFPTNFRPRVINVSDMNGDGIGDLIATFFADTSGAMGSITIFRGLAAEKRFETQPLWRTQSPRISPWKVATARFTADAPGLVAANKGLNTISAYVSDGTGAFSSPSLRMTAVPADARLFVTGDFRSTDGKRKVLDLAFTTPDRENGGETLSVFLNAENRTFDPVKHGESNPPPFTGQKPLLMIAGKFNRDAIADLAIIDENPGDALRRPILRILLGTGNGRFKVPDGLSEFMLAPGEKPVAMKTGHFRNASAGADEPQDIAIASINPSGASPATPGKLTILINDGNGQFPDERDRLFEPIGFIPEAMFASRTFRQEGKFDLAIKQSHRNSFALFLNRGDGRFPRQEFISGPAGDDQNAFESADPVFLVGDIDGNGLDDVVFLDNDLSLDVHANKGAARFTFNNVVALQSLAGKIDLSSARFRLDAFGDSLDGVNGTMGLVALINAKNEQGLMRPAILTLKGGRNGSFSAPNLANILLPVPGANTAQTGPPPQSFFSTDATPQQQPLTFTTIPTAISGQFASLLHGNGKPDIWFLTRFEGKKVEAGTCPNNPIPNPGPITNLVNCPPEIDDPKEGPIICQKPCPPTLRCTSTCLRPVCHNPPCSGKGVCEISKDDCREQMCTHKITVQHPYCGMPLVAAYFAIVANTCND